MPASSPLILFLCHARGQGLLRHLGDWLVALAGQAGGEFQIVGLSEPEEQEPGLIDRLRARGVAQLEIVPALTDPLAFDLLSRAAIVHCHGFQHLAALAQVRRQTGAAFQCVLSVHYFHNGTHWQVPYTNFVSGTLLNSAAQMVHFLSVPSQAEFTRANFLLRRTVPYHIFPLGCDDAEFAQPLDADRPEAWRALASLAAGRSNIVYLASFTRNKQHRWLIDALAPLLSRRDALLWLLGDGPELARIRAYVAQRALTDHILCPGRLPRRHVPWLLSLMQAAVCPSLSENAPHAILEPLFAGVPVVTFDVGTASQLVSDFSRGFVLGRPRVQAEFARKVGIILDDALLRQRMAEEARRFVTQFFTWRTCADNSLAMYRTMLER